jgi:ferredoxin
MRLANRLEAGTRWGLARLDAWMNRLYGWQGNPLYQSGTIAVLLLILVLLTGVYLLFFYRLGDPYGSVARITEQVWLGRWIRGVHRFASDGAIVAVLVHALRLFAQGRSWGPRTLAWLTGLGLFFLLLICGWTGYVMVWDVQGQVLAQQGARLLDLLPIFSEPISRAFVSEAALPTAFFFLNLFLHVALPVGFGLVLWLHVSRVARPTLLPPRRLRQGIAGGMVLLAVLWPLSMAPRANLLRVPDTAPVDYFYAFWLPAATRLPPAVTWSVVLAASAALLMTPWLVRPPRERRPAPSAVDERLCTGCEQCYLDCPYEAIGMHERQDGRGGTVARVNPSLCVSCGICAGSCAPMGVGPPERTGRDQLSDARKFVAERTITPDTVVLVVCTRGAGGLGKSGEVDGAQVYPVGCVGNLHTSVLEFLIRCGVRGVLIGTCPARDCWYREGVRWLEQRVYHGREAELQERVDRRRIRLALAGLGESEVLHRALAEFRRDLALLGPVAAEAEVDLDRECEAPVGAGEDE